LLGTGVFDFAAHGQNRCTGRNRRGDRACGPHGLRYHGPSPVARSWAGCSTIGLGRSAPDTRNHKIRIFR